MRHLPRGLLALALTACTGPQTPSAHPAPSAPEAEGSAAAPAVGAGDSQAPVEGSSPESPHPLLDERAPDPAHALPRLSLKHVGLHVGGGTGSTDERAKLLDALEQREVRLLECYRLVDRPGVGGTFGADLYVAASGGHPEIRALRHKLGGQGFEGCMTGALASVAFGPQPRAIVVSYSLRFEISP